MRNVIVTGGSRGLGLEVVRRLVADGYRALTIARNMSPELSSVIKQSQPGSLHFVQGDLGEIENIPDLIKQLHTDFGSIYGLVNNAALGTDGALAMMHTSQIESLIRLNTLSPIVMTKYVVRHMMADGGGRIVNVASIAAFTGYAGLSVYAATKSSMIGFTRSLAREVGRMGVNVNAVAPGFMDTEMTRCMDSERRRNWRAEARCAAFRESKTWRTPLSICSETKQETLPAQSSPWMPGRRHRGFEWRRV